METKVLKPNRSDSLDRQLSTAGEIIRSGGLVAFPTETVYGLGGNAYDQRAATRIYEAKGRPSDNPLIVHIADMDGLFAIAKDISDKALKLAEVYWPGPFTMVFKKKPTVPNRTTGGLDTVAVRMPSDPIAAALIRTARVPIAAPSANISGRPSPTRIAHVLEDMNGRIPMIIDGGDVQIGLESTIVDVTGDIPVLLRPGAVTLEMLRDTVGEVTVDPAIIGPPDPELKPKAPGMKYKHYAPKADMTIVLGDAVKVQEKIKGLVKTAEAAGLKVGVIATDETLDVYNCKDTRSIGKRTDESAIAHNLFAILREFDDDGVDVIYAEGFDDSGMGRAIMNRMKKAAGYSIVEV